MTDNSRILTYDEKLPSEQERFAQMVAALLAQNLPFDIFREAGEIRINITDAQPPF